MRPRDSWPRRLSRAISACVPDRALACFLPSFRSLSLFRSFTSSAVSAVIRRLPVEGGVSVDQRGHLGVHCVRCQIHMDAESRREERIGEERRGEDGGGDGDGWGCTKDLALIARDRRTDRQTDRDREMMAVRTTACAHLRDTSRRRRRDLSSRAKNQLPPFSIGLSRRCRRLNLT